MDETMKNATAEVLDGQMSLYEDEEPVQETVDEQKDESETSEDPLKEAIETQLKKIQRQNLLLGAQTMCHTILQKIYTAMSQPGKRSMNDYKRLIKDIQRFCEVGLSRKVNADGETEPIEDSSNTDENSTKLMEEAE